MMLDASIVLRANTQVLGNIEETSDEFELAMTVTDYDPANEYWISRIYKGACQRLTPIRIDRIDAQGKNAKIWFKTNKFSSFALMVKKPEESETDRQDSAPSGGGGGGLPQTTDSSSSEAAASTPSETEGQPTGTDPAATEPTAPATTQDAFTGVTETIETSANGTAVVTSVTGNGTKTLRITGTVNQNGTNYAISAFAAKSFSNVDAKNIIIDLKASGSTQRVEFMPKTFKGSAIEKLSLRLTSSRQVKFRNGALSGSKIKKIVVHGLNKKEFRKLQKKLMDSGYTGKIVKK